ncbi:NACHT, LRR and PYD domains-containing protein 12 [Alosa sapidissima]|uniref:NACHT, LRR and PYD domains-containing protein 12 n=1 Tax=Alosa sapidissima TaxID=34773 RepID=UPI001C09004D|nr:NACHT, LRR and PYD domains-containing protein 12 [Alosa sapidissima]
MATTQDGSDSTDSWLIARSAHMQALLTPPLTPEGRDCLLGRECPASVLSRDQHTPLTASLCPEASQLTEQDKSRQGLDEVITSVLTSEDTLLEKRVVVLVGPAGAGKSMCLEKLAQDWSKAQVLKGYDMLLRVCVSECVTTWVSNARESGSVGELEEMKRNCLSLENLLLLAHPHLSSATISYILGERSSSSAALPRLLLLLDGLDQTPHLPDISKLLSPPSELTLCSDPRQPVPISHLLCSLAQGTLLPAASLLIASRQVPDPDALPPGGKCVVVLGFSPSQRSRFFQRVLPDDDGRLASELTQVCERGFGMYELSSRPFFCWTLASVACALQRAGGAPPETLTHLLAHAAALRLRPITTSASPAVAGQAQEAPLVRTLLRGLAQLARVCSMDDCRDFCSRGELASCGLERFLSSPLLSTFLQEGFDAHGDRTFVFLCPVMQQFLTAVSFFLEGCGWDGGAEEMMTDLKEAFVELAEAFVAGLSEASQRAPLEGLLEAGYAGGQAAEVQRWLETHARETLEGYYKERHLRCFRLLRETQNRALVKRSISSPGARLGISYGGMERADCAALSYVLSCAEEVQQLNLYSSRGLTTDHTSLLLPAFKLAHSIILSQSVLTPDSLAHLAEGLREGVTTRLDLSYSSLGDEGVQVLCPALTHSSLRTLSVPVCKLTAAVCKDLSVALAACELRALDLRGNKLTDEGLTLLSNALKSQQCKLQELSLHSCDLTAGSMNTLSEALSCGHCPLTSLDLTRNDLCDSGVNALSRGLSNPGSKIHTLKLTECGLTGTCCAALAVAVRSGGSLTELDLSCNDLGQEGALLLCESLKGPECSLINLSMTRCELTLPVFSALEEVLCGGSKLKALALGLNKVGDRGARHLWNALKHGHCNVQDLDLEMIDLTDECVVDLCEAVRAHGSLKTLILKNNSLTDSSIPSLVQLVKSCPGLKEFNLQYNDLSEDVFELMESCSRIRY